MTNSCSRKTRVDNIWQRDDMIDDCCFSLNCFNVFLVFLSCISDAAFEEPDQQTENGGFSSWPGKQSRRGYSHMVRPSAAHLGSQPGSRLGLSSCLSVCLSSGYQESRPLPERRPLLACQRPSAPEPPLWRPARTNEAAEPPRKPIR